MVRPSLKFSIILWATFSLAACAGAAEDDQQEAEASGPNPSPRQPGGADADPAPSETTPGTSPTRPTGTSPSGTGNAPVITPPAPGESTRLARLTHEQYRNTIQDLLGIDADASSGFAPDALNGFPFATSIDFVVDGRLGPQYRAAAENLARTAVSDAAVFAGLVTCDVGTASCRDQFVEEFGARAFRRPLSSGDRQRFVALFDEGAELVGSGDGFRDGVQVVIEALLQSPQFLYRVELSDEPNAAGSITLDPWETASRLSYFLYDSMPDPELFAAAARDELRSPEQIQGQVARMLDTERALRTLLSFHEQAWHFARFSKITPDAATYPNAPEDFATRVGEASRRFVGEVMTRGGGLRELLTAPYAFADSTLAPFYGGTASGDELRRIELDPTQRRGYLMQVGFLAAHAYAIKTDPIHRGLFVVRDLLCRVIPDPPASASMVTLPSGVSPETTREEIEILTSPDDCRGCHLHINPPGFAFEGFDAVGQPRTEENGHAVETSGTLVLDGAELEFDGPVALVEALAESSEAARCYARKWLEFALGRALFADELSVVNDLATPDAATELVTNIASAEAFLRRSPNEVSR